jgi:hypothetical protein
MIPAGDYNPTKVYVRIDSEGGAELVTEITVDNEVHAFASIAEEVVAEGDPPEGG